MSIASMFPPLGSPLLRRATCAVVAVFLVALVVVQPPATADNGPQTNPPLAQAIPEGTYLYAFAWNGIPSAQSEVVVRLQTDGEGQYYLLNGEARTSKFADIFWRYRARVAAVVEALTGRAQKIEISQQENSRVKETETVFDYTSAQARYTRWKKSGVKEKTISLDGGVIDPACLGFRLCLQPLDVGDSASFTVLVGDDPYALEYTVIARERIAAADGTFDALRIEPRFHKIEEKRKPPKVRQMTLWLSEAEPRVLLKMKSRTFIGHVTGELVRVTPAEIES